MPIGEFTKYGLVFGSSLIGAVSGYFYSSRAVNLRMRLERQGIRVLRSSDQLGMYERLVRQNRKEVEEELNKASGTTAEQTSSTSTNKTESDLALQLLNGCDERLTNPKGKSNREVQAKVTKLCAFPEGMK